jgi:hemolysin D
MSKLDIARGVTETEFLPAALEVQEAPPSPVGRFIVWAVMAMIVIALLWSILGRIEIVAVAPGKIIPSGQVKVIQAASIGRVKAILVADGDAVKAGQALIELDPTLANADRERMQSEWLAGALELARWQAFSGWLETGKAPDLRAEADRAMSGSDIKPTAGSVDLQSALLTQAISEQRLKVASVDQSLARRRAEAASTASVLEKLRKTLPLVAQRAESVRKLSDSNLVAKNTYLEIEQERIEAEQDLAAQESALVSTTAAIAELSEQRQLTLAEARRNALEKVEVLGARVNALRQELIKARDIASNQVLASPVDGVVQQLKVHTIGGVVSPAEPLLVVVPKDQALEVEARVLNKDIGFVRAGQSVTVKVESFPFTRYGVIEGTVASVSNDAIADEKLGLYYAARVRVRKSTMLVDGVHVSLSPGMAVTAEVTTGTRRLIEFLLSPVMEHVTESGRER